MPFNPYPWLPLYAVANQTNTFVLDDSVIDYRAQSQSIASGVMQLDDTEPPPPPGGGGGGTNDFGGTGGIPAFDTNQLWLEIVAVTNGQMYLNLHNTQYGYYYQLGSRVHINDQYWFPGQLLYNSDGTNIMAFDGVPITDGQMFFRGVQGSTKIGLYAEQDAVEPDAASGYQGVQGDFRIVLQGGDLPTSDLAIFYRTNGSAIAGVDYAAIPGNVTLPYPLTTWDFYVSPLQDTNIDFEESLTLTLMLTTNAYVVEPSLASATIYIEDYFATNIFSAVAVVTGPVEIDYHPPTDSLLISYNYDAGTNNFARIDASGSVTNWSGIKGLTNEVKFTIVKTNTGGFTNGDMYFGSGDHIGWLSADGNRSNMVWCTLTNATVSNALPLRGSVCMDQTGVFSNQVIAVASDDLYQTNNKGIWRVDPQGHPTLVATIYTPHLEGVTTITNDVQHWGPWAGKILTGDESEGVIYTIDTNGVTTPYHLGINPEDFDIIPPGENLYCCYAPGLILKLPASLLTNFVGDLLVTQAGEMSDGARLFIVHWDSGAGNFVVRRISLNWTYAQFEHVTFAPIDIPPSQ